MSRMYSINPIALFVTAAVASAILVAFVRRWAQRNAILDLPNERSSHATAKPRGGGLAIVAVVTAVLLFGAGGWTWAERMSLACASALIALVSWLDDLYGVPSPVRFSVHLIMAIVIALRFGTISNALIPFVGHVGGTEIGFALTVIWIAGLTNAYNFMDGIDGIAGSQAVVAGIGWAILTSTTLAPIGITGVAIAGTSFGFLFHNWQPARIFMGDVGSAFLGFLLASLAVIAMQHDPRLFLCGALMVWPFLFDTIFTFLRRVIRHEKVFAAHRSHLYQRLVQTGISHSRVATLYAALAAIGLLLAVAVERRWPGANIFAFVAVVLMATGLWISVVIRETGRTLTAQ